MIAISLVLAISNLLYPPPVGLDFSDEDALRHYIQQLPAGALLIALAAHAAGPLAGSFVAGLITGRAWFISACVLGIIFLAFGAANLAMLPHPLWFAIADVAMYVPVALLGGFAGGMLRRG